MASKKKSAKNKVQDVHVEAANCDIQGPVVLEEPVQERPSLDDLKSAKIVEVKYLRGPGPRRVAGLIVTDRPRQFPMSVYDNLEESHLRALAGDKTISVKIVNPLRQEVW